MTHFAQVRIFSLPFAVRTAPSRTILRLRRATRGSFSGLLYGIVWIPRLRKPLCVSDAPPSSAPAPPHCGAPSHNRRRPLRARSPAASATSGGEPWANSHPMRVVLNLRLTSGLRCRPCPLEAQQRRKLQIAARAPQFERISRWQPCRPAKATTSAHPLNTPTAPGQNAARSKCKAIVEPCMTDGVYYNRGAFAGAAPAAPIGPGAAAAGANKRLIPVILKRL